MATNNPASETHTLHENTESFQISTSIYSTEMDSYNNTSVTTSNSSVNGSSKGFDHFYFYKVSYIFIYLFIYLNCIVR